MGTTFKIYLPRWTRQPSGSLRARSARRFQRGTETILLVEDEEGVRALIRQLLHSQRLHRAGIIAWRRGAVAMRAACRAHPPFTTEALTRKVRQVLDGK